LLSKIVRKRWVNIVTAVLLLGLMGGYAQHRAEDICALPYQNTGNYFASDGSTILEATDSSFIVRWQYGELRTFELTERPPFRAGDRVAFKLNRQQDGWVIEEYHIWKSQARWLARVVLLSVVPLIIIFVVFFKDFRFSWKNLVFLKRR
jgi:hypothetical protein